MTSDVLDWTAGPFLAFYVATAAFSFVAAFVLPRIMFGTPVRAVCRPRLSAAELGFLSGGPGRAADVLVMEDITAGRVVLHPTALTLDGRVVSRERLVASKRDEVARLQYWLAEKGLALPAGRLRAFRLATVGLMCPVLLIGLAEVNIGHDRDKPVGILVILLFVTAVAALVLAAKRSPASRAGRDLVAGCRAEHGRALRAPRAEEVVVAFAVIGGAALAGTAFDAYGGLMKANDAGSAGCGGDGGGGGGCGGCGGGD